MPFLGLPERVREIRNRIAESAKRGGHGQEVRLIAVTKTHGPDAVRAAWDAGLTDVGENKVQEAFGKQDTLSGEAFAPAGLSWHLIGHLQTNKVKALSRFSLFHALDQSKLVDAASAEAVKQGVTLDVLMQVNVVGEESKGGFSLAEVPREAERLLTRPGLRLCGVMTMAPFEVEERVLREVFAGARSARTMLQAAGHDARELSMGMSGDYEIAVEEGATLVRLGTVLFGTRS